MQNLISLQNICFSYESQNGLKQIFNNFNFTLPDLTACGPNNEEGNEAGNEAANEAGDHAGDGGNLARMGLTGKNGAGKTTLLRLIMGLLKPNCGKIELFNQPCHTEKEFHAARCQIGFVFQDAEDQLFCPTVEEDIAFGPLNLGLSSTQARQRVVEVLNEIGMPQYGPRVTYTLSGGEKKLISLGTALAMRPRLLILDEPTAGLDDDAVLRLEKILLNSKLPYLIVSHDQEFLNRTVTSFMHLPPC